MEILHVIKTKRIESDGRLLKWVNTLSNYQIKSAILALEDSNSCRKTDSDIDIQSTCLKSRKFYSQRKGYWIKVPEYLINVFFRIYKSKADAILFHDVQQYLNLIVFCMLKKIKVFSPLLIWDLHELPHNGLLHNKVTARILNFLLENIDLVIYTNEERRQYLKEKLNQDEKKFFILNNFPDDTFINNPYQPLKDELLTWLNGMPYILWMGIASKKRNFQSLIEVYSKYTTKFKIIIMGDVSPEFDKIVNSYIKEQLIYATFVSQNEVQQFVDNALFSIVLYANDSPNNFYCEPNRLYQLIVRRIPIISGCNPVMARTVKEFNAGLILNDDGKSSVNLDIKINQMLSDFSHFRQNMKTTDVSPLSWDKQFASIYTSLSDINL